MLQLGYNPLEWWRVMWWMQWAPGTPQSLKARDEQTSGHLGVCQGDESELWGSWVALKPFFFGIFRSSCESMGRGSRGLRPTHWTSSGSWEPQTMKRYRDACNLGTPNGRNQRNTSVEYWNWISILLFVGMTWHLVSLVLLFDSFDSIRFKISIFRGHDGLTFCPRCLFVVPMGRSCNWVVRQLQGGATWCNRATLLKFSFKHEVNTNNTNTSFVLMKQFEHCSVPSNDILQYITFLTFPAFCSVCRGARAVSLPLATSAFSDDISGCFFFRRTSRRGLVPGGGGLRTRSQVQARKRRSKGLFWGRIE